MALLLELISNESVAKGWIVVVGITSGVDEHRIVVVTPRHWAALPFVEPLSREPKHLGGHRDGKAISSEVHDQRVGHFGESSRAK